MSCDLIEILTGIIVLAGLFYIRKIINRKMHARINDNKYSSTIVKSEIGISKDNLSEKEYLSIVIERLKQQKYQIQENIQYKDQTFNYVAKRTGFDLGTFFTNFFLFFKFTTPDIQTLKDFSAKSFKYAKKARGIQLPRGLLYGLRCFPVAIVDSISQETAEYIRLHPPPKHWAAPELLVVFSLDKQMLHFWKLSFGLAPLEEELNRKIIMEMLLPAFESSILHIY